MAIKGNIVIDQYTSFSAEIEVNAANNANYDLTDHDVKAQMKKSHQATANIQFTAGVANAEYGIIEISLTDSETGSITPGRYVYDVIIIDTTANTVKRVVEGIATVTPGATAR